MYPVNIKNPEENKQTNKQKKESHKMVPQSLGWWRLAIVLAHAHKPDFELLLRICFELYFFLFFFPLPFVLVLLSTLYGDRKALAVFFNRKKRLFFNVAKFPLVSIFICFNLFQWCAISCLILFFWVWYQRSSLVICLCFLFFEHISPSPTEMYQILKRSFVSI